MGIIIAERIVNFAGCGIIWFLGYLYGRDKVEWIENILNKKNNKSNDDKTE